MIKSTLIFFALALGFQGHAATDYSVMVNATAQSVLNDIHPTALLNWKVNDSADYSLTSGFINGTMHMFVREMTAEGFWVEQDIDLGGMGKEKIEALYDKDSGKVLQLIANGQKQTPPDPADTQIIDSKKDHITVPKGDFDVIYVKVHSKSKNTDSEAWINPTAVPVAGLVKTIAPSQLGDITIELTDFKRN